MKTLFIILIVLLTACHEEEIKPVKPVVKHPPSKWHNWNQAPSHFAHGTATMPG